MQAPADGHGAHREETACLSPPAPPGPSQAPRAPAVQRVSGLVSQVSLAQPQDHQLLGEQGSPSSCLAQAC